MTWIRCSDRMPMGEACIAAFRRRDGHDNGVERYMESANAESLREGYEEVCGQSPNWIDRTEWRPVEEPNGLAKVFGAWPGDESDEELLDALRDMDEPGQSVLHAALRRYGFKEQARMLQEECGELVAAVSRWRRGRMGAFPALLEEIADVEILIDQMRLVYGAEIDAARARKLVRLRERLGR